MSELYPPENSTPRHAGMFKPGQSGNPTGRPKSDATIRELAKAHTPEAIETLVEIATNQKASSTAILDRGWGKPAQHVESINMQVSYLDFLDMLADEKIEEESSGGTLTFSKPYKQDDLSNEI